MSILSQYFKHLQSMVGHLISSLLLSVLVFGNSFAIHNLTKNGRQPEVLCRDPRVGEMTFTAHRKFLIYGKDVNEIHGLGNYLLFFPAAYYFAAITGRDIVLADHGIIVEMCAVVNCGFHSLTEMRAAYPSILTVDVLRNVKLVTDERMLEYVQGNTEMSSLTVVRGYGYEMTSKYWNSLNVTRECVAKVSGCPLGDIPCTYSHAFQQLIRGPFREPNNLRNLGRIKGLPDYWKRAIFTLQHSFSPRLDAAVHIRAQFKKFEEFSSASDPEYINEVSEWMESSQRQFVFDSMEKKLVDVITKSRIARNLSLTAPAYVYVASDNEVVKLNFTATIEAFKNCPFPLKVVQLSTPFIRHVNSFALKNSTNVREGFFDLVFDWYALSLCNVILAWRKNFQSGVSTFVHSAQLMSGTTDPSQPKVEGFQLRAMNGIMWQPFRT